MSGYDSLCCNVQNVVTDMVFNLGEAGFGGFHQTIRDIEAGSYATAAEDIQNSLWCRQVGSRCTDDANMLKRGC